MDYSFESWKRYYTINVFQKILDESNRKRNKIWVDKGSEFYNRSSKSWLERNAKKMSSHIVKENLLSLKDLIKKKKIKFINTWFQYQKMFILIIEIP